MKMINQEQVAVILAFMGAVDELSGVWPQIEAHMVECGIDDPEAALEGVRSELEA